MTVLFVVFLFLLQALPGPDPAQMERTAALDYAAVPFALELPDGISMGAPSSVAATRQGGMLVFNRGAHPLIELDPAGRFVRAFGQGLYDRPHGMRVDAAGNIWTTDVRAHTVRKLSPRGEVLLLIAAPVVSEPTDVAFGAGGDVFVVQGHGQSEPRVLKFTSRGALLTSWGGKGSGPGQFDVAHSIVVDGAGVVHVADRQNRRVQRFDQNGTYLGERKYAGLPCGLSIGADGQMYMVSGFAGQVLKLAADGQAIAAVGQAGKGLGEFGEAHYLAILPGGDLYVADTVNARLHRFVSTAAAAAQAPGGLVTQRNLSLGMAKTIAEATLAACKAKGFNTAAVVVDRAGQVLVLLRDEQATQQMAEMARRKAYTARMFRTSTMEFQKRTTEPGLAAQRDVDEVLALGGGIPIMVGPETIGGVGSSGSSQETDDACAKAGVAAVARQLQ